MNVFDRYGPKVVVRTKGSPRPAYTEDYLCHYGIKGQKWGIRRYQDEDGSLTAAGKARVVKKSGYGYLNPSREDKAKGKAKEREKVSEAYVKEWSKYFSADKHPSGPDDKEREVWDSFKDKYAKATLKDLRLKNTKAARASVKALLKKIDPHYDYDAEYTEDRWEKANSRKKELSHPTREKIKRGLKKVKGAADFVSSIKKAVT